MNYFDSKNKKYCSGCSACFNICPKGAIRMHEDENGFKYPVIDESKCIKCGLCQKVCPLINKKESKEKDILAYAAYNKNLDERLKSSSGGIFVLIAKEILNRNGVVFGAAFDENFSVRHIFIENKDELYKLMGSKYVQSNIKNIYKDVKAFLNDDRYVLFSGTPCQIAGLKSYLRRDYEKLYTQDIICHGVPSPKVWNKYLDYQKNNNDNKIKSISFRNKDISWTLYQMKIDFDKTAYNKNLNEDKYMQFFLRNLCLRDSCYNCGFKDKFRESDITLADYWGINNINKTMFDNKGTSLIVVNSDKGKELFELIKDNLKYESTNLNEAIKYNTSMIKSVDIPKERDAFLVDINNMNIDQLAKKYIKKPNLIKKCLSFVKRCIKYILRKFKNN